MSYKYYWPYLGKYIYYFDRIDMTTQREIIELGKTKL